MNIHSTDTKRASEDPVGVADEGVVPDPLLSQQAPPPHSVLSPQSSSNYYRWALGGLALIAAVAGQAMAEDARRGGLNAPPQMSWVLFGVAGLFLAGAMWPVQQLRAALPATFFSTLRALSRGRRLLFLVPLGLSLLFGFISIPLFISLNEDPEGNLSNWLTNTGAWLFYIGALLLFALAFVVWERSVPADYSDETPMPGDRLPRRVEWGILGGLALLAFLLRVPGLETAPPGLWFDEAQNGLVALAITEPDALHPTFIADRTQMGALYFYLLGLALDLFGEDRAVWPLRILPALAGTLIAPMLYLLASRLYGWRVGLAAGGLVAVSAWHISMSRLGLASMFAVALDVAVYLCAAQALRTGRLGYYAAAGVLLGLGMQTYYIARLAPLVLAALLVHRLVTERLRIVKALRSGLVVFAVGALLAFMPVGLFALQQGDIYNARIEEVSIFGAGGEGNPNAFGKSVNAHALMFNFLGDRNGRHNLPGSPMLDWLAAALFFGGIASCVFRAWRWQYFFPVVWLGVAVSGGVLSLLFEAPQAHRGLEASVVAALVGGIFLGELWAVISGQRTVEGGSRFKVQGSRLGEGVSNSRLSSKPAAPRRPVTSLPVRQHLKPKEETATATPQTPQPPLRTPTPHSAFRTWVSVLGIVAAVAWSGVASVQKYFGVQVNDATVWKEMYTAETEAGRVLARYGKTHDVYVTPVYHTLPPSQYLVPDIEPLDWTGMQAIPFAPNATRDVVIALDPPSAADIARIARLYPNSRFELLQPPSNPAPLMYTAIIPASDINALQGVRATVYEVQGSRFKVQGGNEGSVVGGQEPLLDKTVPRMEFDWGEAGVTSGTLRLSATLKVEEYGLYTFDLVSVSGAGGPPASLTVDGYAVAAGTPIILAMGIHSVVFTDTLASSGGDEPVTRLSWASVPGNPEPHAIDQARLFDPRKVEPRGLTGVFREGTSFDTEPSAARLEPVISSYFHLTPLPRPYTAVWSGGIYIPEAGTYTFGIEQLSRSTLYIDDVELIRNLTANNLVENSVTLSAGMHTIRLEFEDLDNYSHMYLYWTPPGKGRAIIPSAYLWPQAGSYPDEPASGPFPTLDDYDGAWLPPERTGGAPIPGRVPDSPPVGEANRPPEREPLPAQVAGASLEPLYTLGDPASGGLPGPFAVAADAAGNVYVFTVADSKIRKLGPDGSQIAGWAVSSEDGVALTEVSAMLVRDGKLLALDAERSELMTFTLDGILEGRKRLCECYYPRGMHVSRDGNLWVSDTGGGKVVRVNAEGEAVSVLGERGTELGAFIEPTSVWETPDGTVYVADVGNNRVQSFGPDGEPIAQWRIGTSNARDGNRLAGDGENVLVSDADSRSVARYNAKGEELGRWSYVRDGEALVPAGIAPLGDGRIVVAYLRNDFGLVFKP